jgi:predicted nucleotidyltransferase
MAAGNEPQTAARRVRECDLIEVVRRLKSEFSPRAIHLFGSHVDGTPHADSDIDLLLIVPDDPPPVIELCQRGYASLRDLDLPVELHFWGEATFERWSTVPASLPFAVKQRGRVLHAA